MKKSILFIGFFCCFSFSARPTSLTDSLERALLKTAPDTSKVRLFNKLGLHYSENNAAKSLEYSHSAIILSEQLKFPSGLIDAYNAIGIAYDVMGKYDSALYNYNLSLKIANEATDNKRQIASILNNIGLVNWNKGEFDSALNYYLQSLKIFEAIDNKKGQANTLSNIGLIYYDLKKYDRALDYHQQALKIREEINDQYGIGVSQTNIGMAYCNLHDVPTALNYLKRSLATKRKSNDIYGEAIALSDIGVMYNELKQYDSSLFYQLKALSLRIQLQDKYGIVTSYCNIAANHHYKKEFKKALDYSLKALPLAMELGSKTRLKKVYEYLSLEYKQLNDLEKALEYYEKYTELTNKIYSEKSAAQIAEMQTKYDTQKKDLELARKNMEINNNHLELTEQKNLRTILWISIAALIFIFYLLYVRYKFKQKSILNETLLKQQELRSKAIVEAEEKERSRIAKELHDGIGQYLSAVKLNLSSLQSAISFQNESEKVMMQNALAIIDESVKEVRIVSHNMMPGKLLDWGLEKAIREFLTKINFSDKLKIEFEVHQLQERLDSTTEIILFRVIQELITNILKHSGASLANIQLIRHEQELTLMVEDNGVGFSESKRKHTGIGLQNIRSRIAYLNGTLNIDTVPQRGTTITIEIPLKK